MTDEITDTMTQRRDRAMDIRVTEGRRFHPSVFLTRHQAITVSQLSMLERESRLLVCQQCVVQHAAPKQHIEFSFVYSEFADDVLKSFWQYVENTCTHCGHTETLALDTPDYTKPWVAYPNTGHRPSPSGELDIWDESRQQHEMAEHLRQQTAKANAQAQVNRQTAKAQALASNYGGGLANSLAAQQQMVSQQMQALVDQGIEPSEDIYRRMERQMMQELDKLAHRASGAVLITGAEEDKRSLLARIVSPKKGA